MQPKPHQPQQTEMVFSETTETTTRSVTIREPHQDVIEAIRNGQIKPSVRGVMQLKSVGYPKASNIMKDLVNANVVCKQGNGRYAIIKP